MWALVGAFCLASIRFAASDDCRTGGGCPASEGDADGTALLQTMRTRTAAEAEEHGARTSDDGAAGVRTVPISEVQAARSMGGPAMTKELLDNALGYYVDVLNKHNVPYFVCFGALLHIFRDGGMPDGDNDIDVVILQADWPQAAKVLPSKPNYGDPSTFQRIDDRVKDGLAPIDFYLWDNTTSDAYFCDRWDRQKFPKDAVFPLRRISVKVNGRELSIPIPGKPEEALDQWYGKAWRESIYDKIKNIPATQNYTEICEQPKVVASTTVPPAPTTTAPTTTQASPAAGART